MEGCTVLLYQAADAENSFAIRLQQDPPDAWRAQKGFGTKFENPWNIEFQGKNAPELVKINWDAVLERAVEARNLSDPVITNYEWPRFELT